MKKKLSASVRMVIDGREKLIIESNHFLAIKKLISELGLDDSNDNFIKIGGECDQGFVDEAGRWYTREEALRIAQENNLLRDDLDEEQESDNRNFGLFSETLKIR